MSEENGSTAQKHASGAGNGGVVPPIEYRWPPGSSANPGGLPKGTKHVKKRLRNALIRKLKARPDQIDAIVDGLIAGCAESDAACQRIVWDRVDGILTQKHEHQGSAVQVNLIFEDK